MADSHQYHCQFVTIHSDWPWLRQTEDGCGSMGPVRFVLAPQAAEQASAAAQAAQWLVVFDEPPSGFCTTVPRERRILFVTEPPEIKKYPRSYLGQFGTVVAPFDFRGVERRSMVVGNPCLNWHYGVSRADGKYVSTVSRLDDFRHMPVPHKTGLVSVVCSSKTATEAQRARIALVGLLREQLGEALHVYGRGFNPVDDKMSAIAPYKYHLVLENNLLPHFWTEKLADAWLGWSLPLYLGAPNLAEVCPAAGFVPLPAGNPKACVQAVVQALDAGLWEARQAELSLCRTWVMETTNVFATAARMIENSPQHCRKQRGLAGPEPLFGVGRADVAAIYLLGRT
ncbi:glycosyltransferase family 10 domain-containing protein [Desulfovibrio sp.]|uniref:glycosyltransferase family 10 domain-containing protein n=1 Tax=Desulfovibrio sp. TaxID=885 RepID=UPI0035AE443E